MAKYISREQERCGTGKLIMWAAIIAAVIFAGFLAISALGVLAA